MGHKMALLASLESTLNLEKISHFTVAHIDFTECLLFKDFLPSSLFKIKKNVISLP